MSIGKSTQGRRDGTNQYDLREMNRIKLVAHMKDGTTRDVPTLVDYEDLRKSGTVKRFQKIEVEQ
jgi:hypothetical protein